MAKSSLWRHLSVAVLSFSAGFWTGISSLDGALSMNAANEDLTTLPTDLLLLTKEKNDCLCQWRSAPKTEQKVAPSEPERRLFTQSQVDKRIHSALFEHHDSLASLKGLRAAPEAKTKKQQVSFGSSFPSNVSKIAYSYTSLDRLDFMSKFDVGVPIDEPPVRNDDNDKVLLIYGSKIAAPEANSKEIMSAEKATEKCSTLKIVLQQPLKNRKDAPCIAIVPQYEAHHLFSFTREKTDPESSLHHSSRSEAELRSLGTAPHSTKHTLPFLNTLKKYLKEFPRVRRKVEKVIQKLVMDATDGFGSNKVVVMVANSGQKDVLANFVCNSKARGMDTSRVLVFATDAPAKAFAESLGLTAYHDEALFHEIPEEAAKDYGDHIFAKVMLAKIYSVHIVNDLGYDVLFQDLDVVWYKHPLLYFEIHRAELNQWDFVFQDDGARSTRFAPFAGNSGFYYVRSNQKTKFFLSAFLRLGDLVYVNQSHQHAMALLLNEHVSWSGLRVKILPRGKTNPFPCGFEYQRRPEIMKKLLKDHQKTYLENQNRSDSDLVRPSYGDDHPYVFHSSWTDNKTTKKKYLEQMGEWYVNSSCAKLPRKTGTSDHTAGCCSAKPLVQCHFRDKPSIIPCESSPAVNAKAQSFW